MTMPSESMSVPFNWPYMTGKELYYIAEAHFRGSLAGDGPFTRRCHRWIEERTGSARALLTHSCTAALEMSALILDIGAGDEVIMPSFTFVSTANAFVLRGATPVFVDVRGDTLNIDERLIEAAITPKTRAIVVVHYAGVACEMDSITAIARKHGLRVIEDAAQGLMSTYHGRPLGALGDLGAFSFHETKNIISGEGGCLLVNDRTLAGRAEIIREKGTDRSRFFRGEIDKYTWQDVGSSFLPGELIAAFLAAQLEEADEINSRRLALWARYHERLQPLEEQGLLRRPVVPQHCTHNAHMYYVLVPHAAQRQFVLDELKRRNIGSVFHYIPLHSAPAGRRFARSHGSMEITETYSERLIRLPMWLGLSDAQQDYVVSALGEIMPMALERASA